MEQQLPVELNRRNRSETLAARTVGAVFVGFAPVFALYQEYARQYDSACRTLQSCLRRPAFANAVRNEWGSDPRCRGLPLESLLVLPMQRVLRYQRVLNELRQHTDRDHDDFESVQAAFEEVSRTIKDMQRARREQENKERMLNIQESFENAVIVLEPSREFISTDVWQVEDHSYQADAEGGSGGAVWRVVHTFLFNNMLLLGRPFQKVTDSGMQKLVYRLYCAPVRVEDVELVERRHNPQTPLSAGVDIHLCRPAQLTESRGATRVAAFGLLKLSLWANSTQQADRLQVQLRTAIRELRSNAITFDTARQKHSRMSVQTPGNNAYDGDHNRTTVDSRVRGAGVLDRPARAESAKSKTSTLTTTSGKSLMDKIHERRSVYNDPSLLAMYRGSGTRRSSATSTRRSSTSTSASLISPRSAGPSPLSAEPSPRSAGPSPRGVDTRGLGLSRPRRPLSSVFEEAVRESDRVPRSRSSSQVT